MALLSCESSLDVDSNQENLIKGYSILPDSAFQSGQERKEYFAKTLANAVTNEDIRSFLKNQSLKMFDNDYDVLYELVKDEEVSKGKTFEEVLKSYASSEILFTNVVNEEPRLTMYVPEMEKWDANKWNSQNEIPLIAVRNEKACKMQEKVKAYDRDGNLLLFDYNVSPERPIVVVKENERIEVYAPSATKSASVENNNLVIKETPAGIYSFAAEDFNGLSPKIETKSVLLGKTEGWENIKLQNSQFVHYYTNIVGDAKTKTPESPRDYI